MDSLCGRMRNYGQSPIPGHSLRTRRFTPLGLSRGLRTQSRFELPRDERDYTGNVRAEQENIANVTIISRPGQRRRKGEGGRRKAETTSFFTLHFCIQPSAFSIKGEGGRWKAEGGSQKAEGGRQKAEGGNNFFLYSSLLHSAFSIQH
jgi:hypothetical protein